MAENPVSGVFTRRRKLGPIERAMRKLNEDTKKEIVKCRESAVMDLKKAQGITVADPTGG